MITRYTIRVKEPFQECPPHVVKKTVVEECPDGDWVRYEDVKELEAENKRLSKANYELQISDPHLEFISRVQDAGLHEEWDAFIQTLIELERK